MFRGPEHEVVEPITMYEQWEKGHDHWHLVAMSGDKKSFTVLRGDVIIKRKWAPQPGDKGEQVEW